MDNDRFQYHPETPIERREAVRRTHPLYTELLSTAGMIDPDQHHTQEDFMNAASFFRQKELLESQERADLRLTTNILLDSRNFEWERAAGNIPTQVVAPLFAAAVWARSDRGETQELTQLLTAQGQLFKPYLTVLNETINDSNEPSSDQNFVLAVAHELMLQASLRADKMYMCCKGNTSCRKDHHNAFHSTINQLTANGHVNSTEMARLELYAENGLEFADVPQPHRQKRRWFKFKGPRFNGLEYYPGASLPFPYRPDDEDDPRDPNRYNKE